MRHHRAGWAAVLAAVVLAGCSESATAPAAQYGYVTSTVVRVKNARGEMVTVAPSAMPAGVRASMASATTTDPVFYKRTDAGVATQDESVANRGTVNGHAVKEALFYRKGLPPQAGYWFVDNKLVATTAYTWTAVAGGWYLSQLVITAYVQSGAPGTVTVASALTTTATYTQTTAPCNPKVQTCGPQHTVMQKGAHAVYALLKAGSCTAWAFSDCTVAWVEVAGTVIGAGVGALFAATGVGAIAEVGLISLMGAALWKLDTCRAPKAVGGGGGTGGGASPAPSQCDGGVGLSCPQAWVM